MISGFDMWLEAGLVAALVLAGLTAILAKRRAAKHNEGVVDRAREGESIRLMALAYQAQGKFDAALQKFQEAPKPLVLIDDLYSLAVDCEKAGDPKRVMNVLKLVQERLPDYRDTEQMMARARERIVLAKAASVQPPAPGGGAHGKPRFGSFEVQGPLGKGVMSMVYRAVDTALGREVALKTVPLAEEYEGPALDKARELFFGELRRAGVLSHPGIATIYDTGEANGVCYIATELARGNELAAFVSPDRLIPADKAVEIVSRAAEALDHAHREGLVHGDVRPGNLIYDANSDLVKVTDFGIARVTAQMKTKSGATMGAPAYQAPEQRGGAPADARSDQYSLALTLRQLLTGARPGEGDLSGGRVDAGVAKVLERALAANPQERFASCAELSGALTAALSGAAMARPGREGQAERTLDIAL
jgi:tRNA A-37 threonylcarbamoyl transferase component Bud32